MTWTTFIPLSAVEVDDVTELGSKRHGVSVQLLQESTAHAKGAVLGRIAGSKNGIQDLIQGLVTDSVSLNNAASTNDLESLLVHITSKCLFSSTNESDKKGVGLSEHARSIILQPFHTTYDEQVGIPKAHEDRLDDITTVGAQDKESSLSGLEAGNLGEYSVEGLFVVVRIHDAGIDTVTKVGNHRLHRLLFSTEGGHDRVLAGRDRISNGFATIELKLRIERSTHGV